VHKVARILHKNAGAVNAQNGGFGTRWALTFAADFANLRDTGWEIGIPAASEAVMRRIRARNLLVVLLLVPPAAGAREAAPDLILLNGRIFTSAAAHPTVQALAIRGERIIAAGDTSVIAALADPNTTKVDLAGRTVIPGINDAHDHLDIHPPGTVELRFTGPDPDWAEVQQVIKAADSKAPPGDILSGDIGLSIFKDPRVTRASLDRLAPNHALILTSITGHADFLNSAALSKLGFHDRQPDPMAGQFEKSSGGKLTGLVREYAVLQVNRQLADLTRDSDAVLQLRDFFSEAVKFGITTLQDMSDALAPARCVALLERVPVSIRVRVMRMPMTSPQGRDTREGLVVPRHPTPLITVSGAKWMLDGTPLEGTFAARSADNEPSKDPPHMFIRDLGLSMPRNELPAMLQESLNNDDQLMLHVSGYPAAVAMLGAMDSSGGPAVWAARRVRFEHGDGLFPDLIPRVKALGIVVVQNPSHLTIVSDFPRIDPRQFDKAQPLRSLLAAGIPVALGSDGPLNPFLNIMFATLHSNQPSEAITREQAVVAYTRTSAYAEFAETEKGTLEPGKLADLVVLSQDIFQVAAAELPKTQSVLTLVGGKIAYDANILKIH
jgi:predicted amidohydrolase YtcJ